MGLGLGSWFRVRVRVRFRVRGSVEMMARLKVASPPPNIRSGVGAGCLCSSCCRSTHLLTYPRLKAASIEVGGENWGEKSQARGPRVLDRRTSMTSVLVAKEYSMAGLQHVRQQLLA